MLKCIIAETKEMKESCFRLRFEVYCREFGFEDPSQLNGEMESDRYDDHSVHFLLTDDSRENIGTSRLILNSSAGFQIEKVFPIPKYLDRGHLAEISRLLIIKEYRGNNMGIVNLCKAMYQYCKNHGVTNVIALIDLQLFNNLLELGFCFKAIGPAFEYHKEDRLPVILNLEDLDKHLEYFRPLLLKRLQLS